MSLVIYALRADTHTHTHTYIHTEGILGNQACACCTDRLQPLDLSVNKAVKNFLIKQFQDWYAKEVFTHLEEDRIEIFDLRLSTVKPLGAQWMVDVFNHFKTKEGMDIKNGYKASGILK